LLYWFYWWHLVCPCTGGDVAVNVKRLEKGSELYEECGNRIEDFAWQA